MVERASLANVSRKRTMVPRSNIKVTVKPSPWRKLKFIMQDQQHSNWCWAAVAASVASFYGLGARFTQAELAKIELDPEERDGTRRSKSPNLLNKTHVLGAPLYRIGCAPDLGAERMATLAEIRKEIDSGRPVCARIIWTGANGDDRAAAGAHFVAIIGYEAGTDRVAIEDPWLDESPIEISYKALCKDYDGNGVWTHTYLTRDPRSKSA
jgi:hypothetical protein